MTGRRAIVIAVAAFLATTAMACSTSAGRREGAPQPASAARPAGSAIEDRWGVSIIGMRLSGGGRMLDFRFRVLDPAKAAPLFDRQTKPLLIEQAGGRSLSVPNMPKVGPLRTSDPPKAGTNYWMFFGNTGRFVKAGSKVTVVIGEFRVEDLVVQ